MNIIVPKINYLNNKDILLEIHKSKTSFCSFIDPLYHQYDIILNNFEEIDEKSINEAKLNRSKRISIDEYSKRKLQGERVKQSDCELDINSIPDSDLIFRIMTYDHIPLNSSRKKNPKTTADKHDKVNFPPFQHWKFDENNQLICVGKSHWRGDINNGHYDKHSGQMTDNLAKMIIKLCERYATRGNVRGYCVDEQTEALTKRGWLNVDQIDETDIILSYHNGKLKWSKIKSIYRGNYDGLMHQLIADNFDAFVSPEHKFMTNRGLIKTELFKETDKLILLGSSIDNRCKTSKYSDEFVKLFGLIMIYGIYYRHEELNVDQIMLISNENKKIKVIHKCLNKLKFKFETISKIYTISSINNEQEIFKICSEKTSIINFIKALTKNQKRLLKSIIDTRNVQPQRNKNFIDIIQIFYTLFGMRTTCVAHDIDTEHPYYQINILSKNQNKIKVQNIEFDNKPFTKEICPTIPYNGRIWCPETEFGCFVARRKGTVYLTGNTYNDEMRGQAILQLTQIGLQFDESKSDNPFSYFTSIVSNSFIRIINIEKRNQNIRDDILEMNGMNPSYTRTISGEHDAALRRYDEDYE